MYDIHEMRKKERAIAKVLQYLRLHANRTQSEIGRTIRINSATVSSHENAKSIPDLYTILKYCYVYNISLTKFFHMVEYAGDNDTLTNIVSDITKEATIFSLTK